MANLPEIFVEQLKKEIIAEMIKNLELYKENQLKFERKVYSLIAILSGCFFLVSSLYFINYKILGGG